MVVRSDGDDGGAGPGDVTTVDSDALDWHGLNEHAVTVWRVRASIGAALALFGVWILALAGRLLDPSPATGVDIVDRTLEEVGKFAIGATGLIAIAWAVEMATAWPRYRRWRWHVSDAELVVEHGWWRHRRLQAPTADVHTLVELAGPVRRRLRVHKVRLYASGPIGSVTIPALGDDAVAGLRTRLGFDR